MPRRDEGRHNRVLVKVPGGALAGAGAVPPLAVRGAGHHWGNDALLSAGEVELLMFHAYEPKSFVVEDDFEFIELEEDGNQGGESASRDYFLITNETVIGEMDADGLRAKTAKVREVIWIRDDGGTLRIAGDPSLSSYFVRISDLRATQDTRLSAHCREFQEN